MFAPPPSDDDLYTLELNVLTMMSDQAFEHVVRMAPAKKYRTAILFTYLTTANTHQPLRVNVARVARMLEEYCEPRPNIRFQRILSSDMANVMEAIPLGEQVDIWGTSWADDAEYFRMAQAVCKWKVKKLMVMGDCIFPMTTGLGMTDAPLELEYYYTSERYLLGEHHLSGFMKNAPKLRKMWVQVHPSFDWKAIRGHPALQYVSSKHLTKWTNVRYFLLLLVLARAAGVADVPVDFFRTLIPYLID